jgi:hypothetical protein
MVWQQATTVDCNRPVPGLWLDLAEITGSNSVERAIALNMRDVTIRKSWQDAG